MGKIYGKISDITQIISAKTNELLSVSISFDEYTSFIRELVEEKENRALIFNGHNKYAASFHKKMGVKRMNELKKALQIIDSSRYSELP